MKTPLARRNFYLLCALPELGPFGSAPPIGKHRLWVLVIECDGPADIVHALLLGDDLLQREAVLAGGISPDQAELAVLPSFRPAEQPLPAFLSPEGKDQGKYSPYRIPADLLWERYFRHTLRIARETRSRFLKLWIPYEVGLRNAMVLERADTLGLDPKPYLVAPELADPDMDFGTEIAEWSAASNPLAALEALDRMRWGWLKDNESWYRFSDDEVAAYAAKLLVLRRWHRISKSENEHAHSGENYHWTAEIREE